MAVTIVQKTMSRGGNKGVNVHRVTYELTSNASGFASADAITNVCGKVKRVMVYPDGTDTPTDNFDIYLYDSTAEDAGYDNQDLLAAAGENLTNAAPTQIISTAPQLVAGDIELVGTNMGDSKKASVILYIE